MRRLSFLPLLVLPLMASADPGTPPVAAGLSESSVLNQALAASDLDKVLALARRLPANDLVDAAELPAQRGEVPAMWVMGQARYLQGNMADAANWMYMALLGTRLDLALCRDSQAQGVMGLWVDGLRDAIVASRNNVQLRSQAIRQAVVHYQQFPQDTQPGWTCRWAMMQRLVKPMQPSQLMVSERQWGEARRDALMRFRQEVGMSTQSSSDTWTLDSTFSSP